MMLRLSVTTSSIADWVRRAATAINSLMTQSEQQAALLQSYRNQPLPKSDTPPSDPEEGQWFFNTRNNKAMMWDGAGWQALW
ncbi:MAG: hypothetical protein ABF461_04305 [Zymomonas mobilis subsp. pomaceae]|uniref:Uncharacterized protein n=1 Tax=Zymomonas mobilis subsp. pomaceae (strain ATCC 29192 / DSM 22645 / JCM 10191 / CCUG 17912 / NBRC 13757 / NCIMB 11200 / NRRL B-4491 / Barker I) TaxID=579138 RepID=F8ESE0_ZYMMT|nr:hypothetical protein [Zymomonas mobilis]AEI37715.1 hypothetical protein Zymop_0814 [Zymomonas mobilis subsp. pomaceae ATCC 29192]MDX5949082.1 hypothetical protein [Zymomonas mobilis subsp. pomaceae]GEB88887.1 hypothetical protein ZMO02_05240 [Zymomonas mobilis subsp. pomaceae]